MPGTHPQTKCLRDAVSPATALSCCSAVCLVEFLLNFHQRGRGVPSFIFWKQKQTFPCSGGCEVFQYHELSISEFSCFWGSSLNLCPCFQDVCSYPLFEPDVVKHPWYQALVCNTVCLTRQSWVLAQIGQGTISIRSISSSSGTIFLLGHWVKNCSLYNYSTLVCSWV